MKSDYAENSCHAIETTVGELVEIITRIALEAGSSEQEGYRLASLAIEDMLRRSDRESRRSSD